MVGCINRKSMTAQEYFSKLEGLQREERLLQRQLADKRHEIIELNNTFCLALEKDYFEFLGKKVIIRFSYIHAFTKQKVSRSVEGYLKGFRIDPYDGKPLPRVAKVNKDGSESKNEYHGEIMPWDFVESIVLVKDDKEV